MTTLITGGTGFLGRHLVDQLLDRDEDDIRVLTRSYDRELAERGVEIVEGSLASEADLERAVDGVDRVYHLAGKVDRRPDHAHEMFELHVDGTRRLLEAADRADVERTVVASTSGTVGVSESPDRVATEDSPTREDLVRDWPYYLSKIYAERTCRDVADQRDIEVVVMRPTLLLGPGDERESSIGDVVLFMKGKIPATMSGGISFVDARDAADGFIRAMEDGEAGESYLLGQANMSLADFFERLEAITGISAPKMPLPDSLMVSSAKLLDTASRMAGQESEIDPVSVEMGQYYWYIDSSKAMGELGWEPRDADQTLRDTVRWIEKHHPDFADRNQRKAPPEEFVPRETVDFAEKMAGENSDE